MSIAFTGVLSGHNRQNPIMIQKNGDPEFGTGAATWTSTTDNAPTNAGWTLQKSSSEDDSNFLVTALHNIYIYGSAYTSVYPGSNTYITMGSGSTAWSSLSFTNPALPGIQLGSADNSWQRVWSKTESYRTMFRYEGTASTGGTPGSPNIVYEVTFWRIFNGYQYIEIKFGSHSRTTGVFGIQTGSGTYVDGGVITANKSYVIRTDATGNSPTIYSGYSMIYGGAKLNYNYTVTTIVSSGYVLLEVNWTKPDGSAGNYTYAQPGSTNFNYTFCAQLGTAYIVDGAGQNLTQGGAC